MRHRSFCDVCGERDASRLTDEERASWWWLAAWIDVICGECRRRFHKSDERYRKSAA